MRLPSVKTLSAITENPKTLRLALEKYAGGFASLRSTLETADALIGGYGVDYIRHKDDGMREVFGIEYVNMGDTYKTTLLFRHDRGTFCVGSWGDVVETSPNGAYV